MLDGRQEQRLRRLAARGAVDEQLRVRRLAGHPHAREHGGETGLGAQVASGGREQLPRPGRVAGKAQDDRVGDAGGQLDGERRMSAMRSGDGDVRARRHGAYGEVRVGLAERDGSDGERLAALEHHAALPGLPAARRDANAPHPRGRCDGHRRRAAVDAVHTDVRARERSPCGLQPHVQLLTRAGSLDAERGGVVDVARRAQADGALACGHADHTGSQSRGDAVDADRGHDSRGVDLQLARELREHQAESLRAAPVHDERCLRRKVPLALRAHAVRARRNPQPTAEVQRQRAGRAHARILGMHFDRHRPEPSDQEHHDRRGGEPPQPLRARPCGPHPRPGLWHAERRRDLDLELLVAAIPRRHRGHRARGRDGHVAGEVRDREPQQRPRGIADPHLCVADTQHVLAAQIALGIQRAAVETHRRSRGGLDEPDAAAAPDRERRSGRHARHHHVRSGAADRERLPEHALAGGLAHAHLPPRGGLHRHAVVHAQLRWTRSRRRSPSGPTVPG